MEDGLSIGSSLGVDNSKGNVLEDGDTEDGCSLREMLIRYGRMRGRIFSVLSVLGWMDEKHKRSQIFLRVFFTRHKQNKNIGTPPVDS